jgi:hypothetical protein
MQSRSTMTTRRAQANEHFGMEGAQMVKFISVALVALMVSSAAVPAFAKSERHGGGKGGGGMHGLSHFGGGRGFGGKMGGAVAAMAIFGLALDAMSR